MFHLSLLVSPLRVSLCAPSVTVLFWVAMKFFALLTALATTATAMVVTPRATNPGNASITIFQPTYLQNIGSPGDTFGISLGELHVRV